MAIVIKNIQQAPAVLRAEGIPVQQNSHRLQGGILIATEDLVQIKDQEPFLVPFVAVDERNLAVGNQQNPARALIQIKEQMPQNLFGLCPVQRFSRKGLFMFRTKIRLKRHIAQDVRRVCVLIFITGELFFPLGAGKNCPEQRSAVFLVNLQRHRYLHRFHQFRLGSSGIKTQCGEQIPCDRCHGFFIGFAATAALQPIDDGKIALASFPQQRPGCPQIGSLCSLSPGFDSICGVLLKDGGKVVIRIVFIPVPDAGQIHAHAFTPMKAAATRI